MTVARGWGLLLPAILLLLVAFLLPVGMLVPTSFRPYVPLVGITSGFTVGYYTRLVTDSYYLDLSRPRRDSVVEPPERRTPPARALTGLVEKPDRTPKWVAKKSSKKVRPTPVENPVFGPSMSVVGAGIRS